VTLSEIILSCAGAMFIIITSLIAFIVSRFTNNMNRMEESLDHFRSDVVGELRSMNDALVTIDRDLREKINSVDRRVVKIEAIGKRIEGSI